MTDPTVTLLNAYCERAGQAGLLAEPLNALTNLGFVVAALLAARSLARVRSPHSADLWLLVAFLFAIGLGSAAWHVVPARHTELMDVIPIWLFINVYLIAALRRLFGLRWVVVVALWLAYFAADVAAQVSVPPDLLNGSAAYLPAGIALVILTLVIARRDAALGCLFAPLPAVFAIALAFRTGDRALCDTFPWGTHFIWHLLNSWMLWRLLRVLIERAALAGQLALAPQV